MKNSTALDVQELAAKRLPPIPYLYSDVRMALQCATSIELHPAMSIL